MSATYPRHLPNPCHVVPDHCFARTTSLNAIASPRTIDAATSTLLNLLPFGAPLPPRLLRYTNPWRHGPCLRPALQCVTKCLHSLPQYYSWLYDVSGLITETLVASDPIFLHFKTSSQSTLPLSPASQKLFWNPWRKFARFLNLQLRLSGRKAVESDHPGFLHH